MQLNVLLVEDDYNDLVFMQELLSEAERGRYEGSPIRFKIYYARNLAEAKNRICEDEPVDIALLDISLPDGFGLDALDFLGNDVFRIPFIILTGVANQDIAFAALQRGIHDYLIKWDVSSDTLLRSIRYAIERHKLYVTLRNLSLLDDLTGLYNRRGFINIAGSRMKLADREGKGLTVFFIDLDGMKNINDHYGHKEGDFALLNTAAILNHSFRSTDTVARIGGDEFAVLAYPIEISREQTLLDRIEENRRNINENMVKSYTIDLSIGFVYREPGNSTKIDKLLEQADELMYKQKVEKRQGENSR